MQKMIAALESGALDEYSPKPPFPGHLPPERGKGRLSSDALDFEAPHSYWGRGLGRGLAAIHPQLAFEPVACAAEQLQIFQRRAATSRDRQHMIQRQRFARAAVCAALAIVCDQRRLPSRVVGAQNGSFAPFLLWWHRPTRRFLRMLRRIFASTARQESPQVTFWRGTAAAMRQPTAVGAAHSA